MASEQILETASGRVRLQRRLGSGAMGTVHLGWHEALNHAVAVKFLTAHTTTSHERFVREGKTAGRIDHPHVVRVVDAGEDHGRAYLVLEFVDGSSLGDVLEHQDTVDREAPPADRPVGCIADYALVERILLQVADGLAAIHAAGVVHRDIKPENLLLRIDGVIKISDLGLAKQVRDPEALRLTGTNMVVGTPLYVSPEGIRHPQDITGAADIYGLGATIYHLLAGRPPFPGATPYEVMRGHLERPVVPLATLRPGIPATLATAVERCLDKDPHKRPTPVALQRMFSGEEDADAEADLLSPVVISATAAIVVAALGLWWVFH